MKIILVISLLALPLSAQEIDQPGQVVPFSVLFHKMDQHLAGSFTYNYGLNHALAIAGTYGLVQSGADWQYHNFMKDHIAIAYMGFPAVILGGLVPLVIPAGLYYYGKSHENSELQITALALGQAAILGFLVSSAYKAVSGRRPPEILDNNSNDPDFSGDFKFGFMERGIFDGWPSGHTTTAFAMATTLIELYPDNGQVRMFALIYASTIGLGVSTNIHWLSDAFAGAFIGYAIGKTVGSGFRALMGKENNPESFNLSISPNGLQLTYSF